MPALSSVLWGTKNISFANITKKNRLCLLEHQTAGCVFFRFSFAFLHGPSTSLWYTASVYCCFHVVFISLRVFLPLASFFPVTTCIETLGIVLSELRERIFSLSCVRCVWLLNKMIWLSVTVFFHFTCQHQCFMTLFNTWNINQK